MTHCMQQKKSEYIEVQKAYGISEECQREKTEVPTGMLVFAVLVCVIAVMAFTNLIWKT